MFEQRYVCLMGLCRGSLILAANRFLGDDCAGNGVVQSQTKKSQDQELP